MSIQTTIHLATPRRLLLLAARVRSFLYRYDPIVVILAVIIALATARAAWLGVAGQLPALARGHQLPTPALATSGPIILIATPRPLVAPAATPTADPAAAQLAEQAGQIAALQAQLAEAQAQADRALAAAQQAQQAPPAVVYMVDQQAQASPPTAEARPAEYAAASAPAPAQAPALTPWPTATGPQPGDPGFADSFGPAPAPDAKCQFVGCL